MIHVRKRNANSFARERICLFTPTTYFFTYTGIGKFLLCNKKNACLFFKNYKASHKLIKRNLLSNSEIYLDQDQRTIAATLGIININKVI